GDILAVTGTDEDGNYIGEWVDPAMEFPYVGPVPQTMTIVGPAAPVRGNTGHILRANVQLTDGQDLQSVNVVWTAYLPDGSPSPVPVDEVLTVGASNGVVRTYLIAMDTDVIVRATWIHPESNIAIEQEFTITVLGDASMVRLTSIVIDGPITFNANETGTYTLTAAYSDGTETAIDPALIQLVNSDAGTIENGVVTPHANQVGNKTSRLTA